MGACEVSWRRMASRASGQDMWALTSTVIDAFCPELKVELMSGSPCKPLSDLCSGRVAHLESSGSVADDGQGVHVNEVHVNETQNQTQPTGLLPAAPAAPGPQPHTAQPNDAIGVTTTGSSETHLQEGGETFSGPSQGLPGVSEASVALLADAAGTLTPVATAATPTE